jgi:hypothetical protein
MGCNCGAKKLAGRQTYEVKFSDGSTKSYGTEFEAKAAIARKGGGTLRIRG